jgi:hypothetical protein
VNVLARQLQSWETEFDGGAAWRKFWFAPIDPTLICFIRAAVGAVAFLFVASHTADLTRWFGRDGMLPIGIVQQLVGAESGVVFRPSYFYIFQDAAFLWLLHAVGLAATLAMTVGWKSRWSSMASLAVVLSYVHRAPMLTGQMEPVLCFAIFYLCFAPTGARLSIDARRRPLLERCETAWAANFSLRLLQIHVAALYLLMATTQLASMTWWQGDALWWLSAYSESRLIDATSVLHRPYVFSFLTHLVVGVELAMTLLIWLRPVRPFLLIVSAAVWLLLALLTGLVGFALLMVVVNMAFVPPGVFRAMWASEPAV